MKKQTIRCPYCGSPAILKDASYVYGNNSFRGKVYVCSRYPDCDSYVGVHQGSLLPKGSLAGPVLRKKRVQAHGSLTSFGSAGSSAARMLTAGLRISSVWRSARHILGNSVTICATS